MAAACFQKESEDKTAGLFQGSLFEDKKIQPCSTSFIAASVRE